MQSHTPRPPAPTAEELAQRAFEKHGIGGKHSAPPTGDEVAAREARMRARHGIGEPVPPIYKTPPDAYATYVAPGPV